jgi:type IV pilus assembly protein PilO
MITRPQVLLGIPLTLGGLVALTLGGLVLWPQWQQVQVGRSRVAELQEIESQLPLMAQQLGREQQGVEKAQGQQALVLQLIAGSGNLSTFMAQVDRLAALSGVKLSLYEPLVSAAPAPDAKAAAQQPKPAGKDEPPPPPADPLLAPGVAKQEVLVSAAGRYPALLAFIRQLEKLSALVVQSNLQLSAEEQKSQAVAPKGPQVVPPVQLKMSVATYYRAPQ